MSNYGIKNTGSGDVRVSGVVAMGRDTSASQHGDATTASRDEAAEVPPVTDQQSWDAGVVTVLTVETRALIETLSKWGTHTEVTTRQGLRFHEFTRVLGERTVRVVATQTLLPGQHSAGSAVESLRREYAPRLVALVGIAGAIHPDVHLGDVVLAQEVVHYEPRKVTPQGARRRGRTHVVTASVQHAINGFFTHNDEPWALPESSGHRAMRGLIGSGEAVLADVGADERRYLHEYNEKILAVETEGAGLASAVHASVGETDAAQAWLMVRGISDAADSRKDDSHHRVASENAAYVFRSLLPHLL
ncbi:5'-methylthioadenosine/S-adenosylhomocysteine nucleosidase family protein [Streptomyces violascens]|uniref:5'-methylthioadenosine/S-adenosylhomocysteine nucleosidase family protein n=1 Tax=Streptomyces violascens TaxID=67381 RepID=UPI003676B038